MRTSIAGGLHHSRARGARHGQRGERKPELSGKRQGGTRHQGQRAATVAGEMQRGRGVGAAGGRGIGSAGPELLAGMASSAQGRSSRLGTRRRRGLPKLACRCRSVDEPAAPKLVAQHQFAVAQMRKQMKP